MRARLQAARTLVCQCRLRKIGSELDRMERLKRRTDFRAAAAGARVSAGAFVLQARHRDAAGPVRIGFTVSKQVGNAVERNRVRRRLREMVRRASGTALCAALHANHDYVLIGRAAALKTPFADMVRELDAALRRIHAIATESGKTGTSPGRPLHRAGSSSRPPRRPK